MKLPVKLIGLIMLLFAIPVSADFKNLELSEAICCTKFTLSDAQGKKRTLADYRGKVVVLSFGFTHCPVICPTTLQSLAETMLLLGDRSRDVQVLFVTLDPKRDTAQVLAKYVPSFNSSFAGLRGSDAETERVAKEFRIFYRRVPSITPGSYTLDHSTGVYVMDKSGKARVFASLPEPTKLASDITKLLNSP